MSDTMSRNDQLKALSVKEAETGIEMVRLALELKEAAANIAQVLMYKLFDPDTLPQPLSFDPKGMEHIFNAIIETHMRCSEEKAAYEESGIVPDIVVEELEDVPPMPPAPKVVPFFSQEELDVMDGNTPPSSKADHL